MSYSLIVYAVPTGSIQRLVGSKDETFRKTFGSKFGDWFADNDEFFEDMEDDEDEPVKKGGLLGKLLGKSKNEEATFSDPYPTSEQILDGILNGDSVDTRCGGKAGYVFEKIAETLGSSLPASSFAGIRRSEIWFSDVDEVIQKGGLNPTIFSIGAHLVNRGPIISLPPPDDFPGMGYLTCEEATIAMPFLNPSAIDDEAKKSEHGKYMTDAVADVRQWLKTAVERQCDLLAFYY